MRDYIALPRVEARAETSVRVTKLTCHPKRRRCDVSLTDNALMPRVRARPRQIRQRSRRPAKNTPHEHCSSPSDCFNERADVVSIETDSGFELGHLPQLVRRKRGRPRKSCRRHVGAEEVRGTGLQKDDLLNRARWRNGAKLIVSETGQIRPPPFNGDKTGTKLDY